jgi:glycosyltransferase involved in cell wall biosynthesis
MTPRVYHLADSLGACAAGRALALVLPRLPGTHAVAECYPSRPLTGSVPIREIGFRSWFDPKAYVELKKDITQFQPTVLHAWGRTSARILGLLRHLLPGRPRLFGANWQIPPIVELAPPCDRPEIRRSLGIPESAELIVASGGFEADANLRDAVWAFDILKYAHPNARLMLVGDGPGRAGVEQFQRGLAFDDDRAIFTGLRADAPALFAAADQFWMVARTGGAFAALEALAAGAPVIAFDTPASRSIPVSQIVPFGDKPALAKASHRFFESEAAFSPPNLAAFAPEHLVSRLQSVYDSPSA